MRLKNNIKRKLAAVSLGLGLYAASVIVSAWYFYPRETGMLSPVPEGVSSGEGFDLETFSPENSQDQMINVLLLGYGGAGHPGGNLTDTLMVVNLNLTDKRINLISIPRDIWLRLPDEGENRQQKINTAFVEGGGESAKKAAAAVIGMPVKYYATVSFEEFKGLIDGLGGVAVEVPVAFDDYYYPVKGLENESCGKSPEEVEAVLSTLTGFEIDKQFPCRYEHLHFEAGKQEMDGETALKFVRSRHSAQHGGDFARSVRQQALLTGIKDKLVNLRTFEDFAAAFRSLAEKVRTDINEEMVGKLLAEQGSLDSSPIGKVYLTTENVLRSTTGSDGQYRLVPESGEDSWDEVHIYIQQELTKNQDAQ